MRKTLIFEIIIFAFTGCYSAPPLCVDKNITSADSLTMSSFSSCFTREISTYWGTAKFLSPAEPVFVLKVRPPLSYPSVYTTRGYSGIPFHVTGNERVKLITYATGVVSLAEVSRGVKLAGAFDMVQGTGGGGHITLCTEDVCTELTSAGTMYGLMFTPHGSLMEFENAHMRVRKEYIVPTGLSVPVIIERLIFENLKSEKVDFRVEDTWNGRVQVRFPVIYGYATSEAALEEWESYSREFTMYASELPDVTFCSAVYTHDDFSPQDITKPSAKDTAPFEFFRGLTAECVGCSCDVSSRAHSISFTFNISPGELKHFEIISGWKMFYDPSITDFVYTVESYDELSSIEFLKERSLIFALSGRETSLVWESIWHSQMLQNFYEYHQLVDGHFFTQGSAYEFLQCAVGAVRDFVFSIIPAIYLSPERAREALLFIPRMTDNHGRIFYSLSGVDRPEGAVIHERPSDLQIFTLWGFSEYLIATRDFSFLTEAVTLNSGETITVGEYLNLIFYYLRDEIGTGAHGLLRILDGDWNDGVLTMEPALSNVREEGESVFNTAMAVYVLSLFETAINDFFPEVAADAVEFQRGLSSALRSIFNGRWFPRMLKGDFILGQDRIFLDVNVFGVLSGVLDKDERDIVIENIEEMLDIPEPAGALSVYPPYQKNIFLESGSDVNGGVWYALNGLLAWVYCREDADRAVNFLKEFSIKKRGEVYPFIWYGLWTGPDSINAYYHERPGETFAHLFTAMTDFPAFNSNFHAAFLLAALRCAGIEPSEDGLRVVPYLKVPFALFAPWVRVYQSERQFSVYLDDVSNGTPVVRVSCDDGQFTYIHKGEVANCVK